MSLTVESLNKYYKKKKVLDDLSFEIKKGQIVALVGQNGAGKTTTIKSMLKFCKYDGDIKWQGQDIGNLMMAKKVGYAPEALLFNLDVTVIEYLNEICHLKNISILDHEFTSVLEKFSLEAYLYEKVKNLSKGMKRKLIVFQATLGQPDLLILDEPTDGLDPIARLDLISYIKELAHGGMTVLITTHLLYDIQNLCDQILIMREGRLLKRLEKKDFVNADLYNMYYSMVMARGDQI